MKEKNMEEDQKEIKTMDERYGNETLTIERNLLCKYSGWQVNVFIVLWTHREGMTKEELCEYLRSGPGPARALRNLEGQGVVAPDANGVYTIQEKYLDMSLPVMKHKPAVRHKLEGDQKVIRDTGREYYCWLREDEDMNYICNKHGIVIYAPRSHETLETALMRYHTSFVNYLMNTGDTGHNYFSLRSYFDNWMEKIRAKERHMPPTPTTIPTADRDTNMPF